MTVNIDNLLDAWRYDIAYQGDRVADTIEVLETIKDLDDLDLLIDKLEELKDVLNL